MSLEKFLFRLERGVDADHWLEAILVKSGDLFAEVTAGSGDERIAVIAKTVGAKIATRPTPRGILKS